MNDSNKYEEFIKDLFVQLENLSNTHLEMYRESMKNRNDMGALYHITIVKFTEGLQQYIQRSLQKYGINLHLNRKSDHEKKY